MSNTIRAFIAIELPETIKSSIETIQARLKSLELPLRWVRVENIHLTMKFIGDIEEIEIESIESALRDSVKMKAPLTLSAKGVGVFPGIRRPRVLWVGIHDHETGLAGLQKSIENQLHRIGYSKEGRPFKGHLTVGRAKGYVDERKLKEALDSFLAFESSPFTVNEFFMFRSVLKPGGPEYTKLIRIPLTRENPSAAGKPVGTR
ncbi:MAG: RNA 2',3'-cyclic phosphodiesterase [Deltaproteobacteria bacterium]|nr:RNA 2',3'-cyclic phosphodiesterase [Deltaproteobacteria bacterium]